jgi:hypothetical protein
MEPVAALHKMRAVAYLILTILPRLLACEKCSLVSFSGGAVRFDLF